jgi:hypothetical protein
MFAYSDVASAVTPLSIHARWGHRCKRIKGLGPEREHTRRAPRVVDLGPPLRKSWLARLLAFFAALVRRVLRR